MRIAEKIVFIIILFIFFGVCNAIIEWCGMNLSMGQAIAAFLVTLAIAALIR